MASGRPGQFVRRAGVAVLCAGAVLLLFHPHNSTADPPAGAAGGGRTDLHGDPLPEGALQRLGTVRYRPALPNDVAASPDGKVLATASDGDITLWDLATGRPLHRLRGAGVPTEFTLGQKHLCFSPDGKYLVSFEGYDRGGRVEGPAEGPCLVHLWDVRAGKEVRRFPLAGEFKEDCRLTTRYVWFTPGGKELGLILHSGVVRFLDPATGKELRRWAIGQFLRLQNLGVAASPDGKLLAVAASGDEEAILLFDVATGRKRQRIEVAAKLGNLEFSPDSTVLAVADDRDVLRLFEVATGKECKSFAASVVKDSDGVAGLRSLAYSADGKVLYAGTWQGQLLRWRMPGAAELPAIPGEPAGTRFNLPPWVTRLFPAPDGRSVVSLAWPYGLIRRWDAAAGKEVLPPEGFSGGVCCRLSPDGRLAAIGDYAGRLALFETATGRTIRLLRSGGPAVSSLCWSPDGKTLAVGHGDDTVGLWDAATWREFYIVRLPLTGKPYSVQALGLGPGGRRLLISHERALMREVGTGRELWSHESLGPVALSPDGKTAALVNCDGLVLLDAATGAVRATEGPGGRRLDISWPGSIAFSPDGSRLGTSHSNGAVRIRDPQTAKEVLLIRASEGAGGHSLTFSPDGKWLLGAAADSVLRLWEVTSGRELAHRSSRDGLTLPEFATAEFGPGLRTSVAAARDSTALVWDLRPPAGPGNATPESLWADLASDEGPKIYRAILSLCDDPKAAVALFREKLPPAVVDEKRVRQLASELDADAYAEREKAARELSALGTPAVPLLKKLREDGGSAERRHRLQRLIVEVTSLEELDLRRTRAVQVLELAATPEARQLLRDWSAGASGVALAEDARAALGRLERAGMVRRTGDKP
jgi:WD40 repeat protein